MLSFVNLIEAHVLAAITRENQVSIEDVSQIYLSRVEWDEDGLASRLYPFTGKKELGAPKCVVIDPRFAFGRPVLSGTSIPTQVIAERFKAGDSPLVLAADYGRSPAEILEAIRCELAIAA